MTTSRTAAVAVLVLALAVPAIAADNAENNDTAIWGVVTEAGAPGGWRAPDAVLYDNGPFLTDSGTGLGGADESVVQTISLGMTTLGFGAQASAGNRIADQFEIPSGQEWQIDTVTFFAYQSFAPTSPSSLTAVTLQIWNGSPDSGGSSVVWGDEVANCLTSSSWTNVYRVSESTTGQSADRPIQAAVCTVNLTLSQGIYWLDWQFDGSASYSGPWAPPITIPGNTTTGDAIQYIGDSSSWGPALDGGTSTQQGFPFIVDGSILGGPTPHPTGGAPIPTISRTGIVVLSLLIVGLAAIILRRRS